MESLTIRKIIETVESGQIRIPAFQRGFVWEPDRVAFLMDSIYKGYPYGALLFWRTNEILNFERDLGPFTLPDPADDYPIDYVLDGQQRITSVYATFQTSEQVEQSEDWKDIFFDYSIADDAQETQFYALLPEDIDNEKHFPLRTIFDSVQYRKATASLPSILTTRLDAMQSRFKEAAIPVQIFRTEERGTVAVIFERINRQGVPLDTMQLLSAWTWSEEFQLQQQFDELAEEIESQGYIAGQVDENLLLRCTSAVLVGNPRPEAIVEINGEVVRNRFDEVVNGITGALDFLRSNLGIQRIDNLPFQTILVPLSVFFAVSGNSEVKVTATQRKRLMQWFWKTCFSRRYSSGVIRYLKEDITSMLQLKGGQSSNLGQATINIPSSFFTSNNFSIRNVNTKTFVLLLAQAKPLSLVSGNPVDLAAKLKDYNKTEFHHLMPKKFLKEQDDLPYSINCLANYCFITRSENKVLGGDRPSEYRDKMPDDIDDILGHAICPEILFDDIYSEFIDERATLLAKQANLLFERILPARRKSKVKLRKGDK